MGLFDDAGRPAPTEIRYVRADKRLDIAFENGTRYGLSAEFLRVESPSAEVKGHGPDQRVTVGGRRYVGIAAIEPVGRYAIRIKFDDGHDTGLYSWAYLYEIGAGHDAIWQAYLENLEAEGLSREL